MRISLISLNDRYLRVCEKNEVYFLFRKDFEPSILSKEACTYIHALFVCI